MLHEQDAYDDSMTCLLAVDWDVWEIHSETFTSRARAVKLQFSSNVHPWKVL